MRYRDIAAQHSVSEQPTSNSYLLQLERDNRAGMLILHILDKRTGKRTEVRGKMGYETNGYDPNDKLHQLLDKVGKSASVSDLMNGDVVSINPRHPDGASAKAAADKAYDEDRHPNEKPIGPETKPTMPSGTIRVKVSDVYDWYKLGQHISDLEGLGKHDFGKGPPEAVISFGSEEQEHKYIELLKQLGLEIIDVDPKAADVPGVKTDPTYNTESLDQPYPYRWGVQSEDEWAARARTDSGAILDIRFEYGSWDAIWDIEFTLNGRYKATAAGDQFRIFATVVKAIKEWWKSTSAEGIPVNTIRFSADKLNNQTGKTGSREKLYNRFAQQFANSIGFTIQSRDKIDATDFELINPNYSKRKVNEAVESGKEMLKIFRGMHHDAGMNKDMDRYIQSHDWKLRDFTPDMFPSEEEFFDYDDPFDRVIDIDYSHRVNLSAPIIVGPRFSDGKYSVIDGNHRAATAQKMGKTIQAYFPVEKTNENFADGKNPGRKGLSKRMGVNTKASVSSLRKTAKNSSGEKQRMAHWLANMKAGRKKAAKK